MNLNKSLALGVLLLSATSQFAQAEILIGDYKELGDSKVVLDTSTGLEWLNLTETNFLSVSDVESFGFEGFRVATAEEYERLYHNITDVNYTGRVVRNINQAEFDAVSEVMGSVSQANGGIYSYGRVDMGEGVYGLSGVYSYKGDYGVRKSVSEGDSDVKASHVGVYLVNEGGVSYSSLNDDAYRNLQEEYFPADVPIGGSVFAFLAVAGLSMRKRKRH